MGRLRIRRWKTYNISRYPRDRRRQSKLRKTKWWKPHSRKGGADIDSARARRTRVKLRHVSPVDRILINRTGRFIKWSRARAFPLPMFQCRTNADQFKTFCIVSCL